MTDLDAKLDQLQAKKKAEVTAEEDRAMRSRGMAYGFRMSSELVAAIVVGGLIGYALDRWFDTWPLMFLVFFFLGFAAGVLNVLRAFQRMQGEIKQRADAEAAVPVKDDED